MTASINTPANTPHAQVSLPEAGHNEAANDAVALTIPLKMQAHKVNVFYGAKQALFDVELKIRENKVTALIGPSGCGKSTFLRCLNRMNDTIPNCRFTGTITLGEDNIYDPAIDVVELRAASAWCSRSPTRSRNPSTRTSPTARASTASPATRPSSTRSCATALSAPACGTRSRTACPSPAPAFPAASSSACASRAPSPPSPK